MDATATAVQDRRERGMTSSDFANIGKFTVAILVYLLGTALVGGVTCLSMDDTDFAPCTLWLWGAIMYATTVMILWKI